MPLTSLLIPAVIQLCHQRLGLGIEWYGRHTLRLVLAGFGPMPKSCVTKNRSCAPPAGFFMMFASQYIRCGSVLGLWWSTAISHPAVRHGTKFHGREIILAVQPVPHWGPLPWATCFALALTPLLLCTPMDMSSAPAPRWYRSSVKTKGLFGTIVDNFCTVALIFAMGTSLGQLPRWSQGCMQWLFGIHAYAAIGCHHSLPAGSF